MNGCIKIKLHGKLKEALGDMDDLFIVDGMAGGPIVTEEQYKALTASTAALRKNGDVMRCGRIIGSVSDIEEIKDEA